jgi:putative nucleotidyltransferase with HDIG domain
MAGILVERQIQVKIVKQGVDSIFMHDINKLKPLEIELKKVVTLKGGMSVVAVPNRFKEKLLNCLRDVDTAVSFMDYEIVAMMGLNSNEASSLLMAIPKGIAIYPLDGKDLHNLVFLAIDRLNQVGDSAWAKSMWESLKQTSSAELKENPEIRFVRADFYQFYHFLAQRADISDKIIDQIPPSTRESIRDLLPAKVISRISKQTPSTDEDIDHIMKEWSFDEKFAQKKIKGINTLKKYRNFEQLNTLPLISKKIMALAQDMDTSASRMAAIIDSDPAITSKILKVVNSAFYGFHRKIESVEHAIVILGNNEVINLSISLALNKFILDSAPAEIRQLWMHSLLVAHLSHWIGTFLGCHAADLTYTIGLLHDIGKIAMAQHEGLTSDISSFSTLERLAAEEIRFGLSHAELGAYIVDRWQLPEDIVDSLRAHHLPAIATNEPQAVTVHIADYIAHEGHLDMDMINYFAAQFIRRPGISLNKEIISSACMDMKKKVEFILSL